MFHFKCYMASLFILCLVIFSACENPTDDTTQSDTPKTQVEFTNLEQYSATIYSDSARLNVFAEVAANGTTTVAATPAPAGTAFYPTFHFSFKIDTAEIIIPFNGPAIIAAIETDKTNLVKIPKLEAIEIDSSYIFLINNSDFSLALREGTTAEKSPIDGGTSIINPGLTAVYKILPGSISGYSIRRNTEYPIAFPADLTEFRRGIIYVLTYNGTDLTLSDEVSVLQTIPPAVPENVQAEVLSKDSVRITWNEVFGATSYRIYRAAGSVAASYSQVTNTAALSWINAGLTAGEMYYYKVSALSGGNRESAQSMAVSAVMSIVNVWVNAVTDSSVSLAWSTVSGADGYNVYRSDSENGIYTKLNSDEITSAAFTDTGLEIYTAYYYKVSAVLNGIENELSDAFSITLLPASGNVRITSVTDSSISLEWNAVSGANGYSVYHSNSENGTYSKVNSGTVTDTAFTNTGLDGFTTYYYKVSAISGNIECVRSDAVSVTTLLSVPGNVQVSTITDNSVSFTWNLVNNASGYNIYRSDSENGNYGKVNSNTVTDSTFTDTGLAIYSTYYYKISAVANSTESELSGAFSITLLPAPGNVQITSVTANSIGLAWDAVNGVNGYNVYRSNSENGVYTKINNSTVNGITFTDTGINPYIAVYYYKVSVVSGGTGIQSNPIASPSVTVPGSGLAAKLAWLQSNAQSNNLYIIEVDTDEYVVPQTISYSGKSNVGIILIGKGTMRMVNFSAQGRLLTIGSGVTLTLDNNITLNGRNANSDCLVYIGSGGTLIMNEGCKITGNSSSSGGGVMVGSGTFYMKGGEISNNSSSSLGGGVYVLLGTFYMSGGEISNNSSSSGGGVMVGSGTFYMIGGEISNNSSSSSLGGGVYVIGTFYMSGGVIYGSNAVTELQNKATTGVALYKSSASTTNPTAQYGTFSGGTFFRSGNLETTNTTIRIVNGNLLTE